MSVDVVTFGCRLNIAESEVIRRAARRARRCGRGQHLRGDRGSGAPGAPEHPPHQARAAATRASSSPAARRRPSRPRSPPCPKSTAFSATRKNSTRDRGPATSAYRGRRHHGGETARAHAVDGIEGHTRAFVQVQNGCDHRCTFCIIPFGRGNSRSVPMDEVVAQARRLAEQRLSRGGADRRRYHQLRRDLPARRARRAGQAHSEGRAGTGAACGCPRSIRWRPTPTCSMRSANEPRLMPHLHLSLQAGDDLILKRMKRRHTRADAIAFCEQVRRLRPDVVFGADIIAGFPTETEAMFARSLDLVDECGLTQLHVFPFSPRPGTPAARMPQVDRARHQGTRPRACAKRARRRCAPSRRASRRAAPRADRTRRHRPHRAIHAGAACGAGRARRYSRSHDAGHDGRQLLAA